ncbi:MAG: hypothetical protein KDK99_21760 [Verrucomicrobiales bacterium]|nr:hypothetical protein [Verrucomicrobiales bacterium]
MIAIVKMASTKLKAPFRERGGGTNFIGGRRKRGRKGLERSGYIAAINTEVTIIKTAERSIRFIIFINRIKISESERLACVPSGQKKPLGVISQGKNQRIL